jgi:hypothetical protein
LITVDLDCKSPLRSPEWLPGREKEGREPVFGDAGQTLESKFMKYRMADLFGTGLMLQVDYQLRVTEIV